MCRDRREGIKGIQHLDNVERDVAALVRSQLRFNPIQIQHFYYQRI